MKEGGCNQIGGGGGGVVQTGLSNFNFKKKKIDFKKMQVVHKM